jgi:hypothetical protein
MTAISFKQGALGLTDAEFFSSPLRSVDGVVEQMMDEGFAGLFVDGPAALSPGLQTELPIVGVRAAGTAENVRVPLDTAATLTVAHLESHDVFVTSLFPWKPTKPRPPIPVEDDGGRTYRQFLVDVRERIPTLPQQRGTLLITVLLFDQASNPVRVRVQPPDIEDPEVDRFLEAHRRPGLAPAIEPRPGQPIPSYVASERTPPVPSEPGISLRADRVTLLSPVARCMLYGSFLLHAIRREILTPLPGRPTAVVPVTLVLTSRSSVSPSVVRLGVPSYDPIDPRADRPLVRGTFELDLLELAGAPTIPESYALWALAGEVLSGPLRVALVTEEMLPRD